MALDAKQEGKLVCLVPGCKYHYLKQNPYQCKPGDMHKTASKHCDSDHGGMNCMRAAGFTSASAKLGEHMTDAARASFVAAHIPSGGGGQSSLYDHSGFKPMTTAEKVRKDRSTAIMIARTGLPDNILEDPAFREWVMELSGGYCPCSRRTSGRHQVHMLSSIFKDLATVFANLAPNQWYAMTGDIWSDRTQCSFLGILLHCIDVNFILFEITAGVNHMPGSHCAEVRPMLAGIRMQSAWHGECTTASDSRCCHLVVVRILLRPSMMAFTRGMASPRSASSQ